MKQVEIPPNTDLYELAKKVYELSGVYGMGALQDKGPGPMSDEVARKIVDEGYSHDSDFAYGEGRKPWGVAIHMDYIHGRCCKFLVWKDDESGKLTIADPWPDHSAEQLKEILDFCEEYKEG